MNIFEIEKEFNELIKHGQELIEKIKRSADTSKTIKEADENDVGFLCEFWCDDNIYSGHIIGILERIDSKEFMEKNNLEVDGFYVEKYHNTHWQHCRRLTPDEVSEITGYKVEE